MLIAVICAAGLVSLPLYAQDTPPAVTAEAVGQANLRAWTDTTAALLGEIRAGTQYPVIGRSALYPWLLLSDPATGQPLGWAFRDLLTLRGDLAAVPVTEIRLDQAAPTVTPAAQVTPSPIPTGLAVFGLVTPTVTASAPLTSQPDTAAQTEAVEAAVRGIVQGEINIRYEPSVDSARIGIANAGDVLSIIAWHTQLPWVQIRYEASPVGTAWVSTNVVTIEGDLYGLPAISQVVFNLPTLTPTPSVLETANVLSAAAVPISESFRALGGQLWSMMLDAGFDPATSRLGAMFVMDLQTGEAVTFGSDIAFSGTSVSKISILAALYDQFVNPPDDQTAYTIADAMICSENISTNRMLTIAGNGNPYSGAETVSAFLQRIGLENTFIYTPFANDPFITPQAPRTRQTNADQTAAQPDPFNQITVNEVGGLLNSVYQCSVNGTGALIDSGTFTQTECSQMIRVMSGNRIGNLIEAGVPANVTIAHKHGWIDDTHGDAALVFSPGGDYIFVVVLHNPVWLNFDESSTLVAEMSRTIYNYFNPDAPMTEVRYEQVPATCDLLGSPFVEDLQDPLFGQP
ncbi:MAG: serine hydrolase [bacterium]|nr:serine hydrolase [bacterium]